MTRAGITIIRNINASAILIINVLYLQMYVNIIKLLVGRGGSLKCMHMLSKTVSLWNMTERLSIMAYACIILRLAYGLLGCKQWWTILLA